MIRVGSRVCNRRTLLCTRTLSVPRIRTFSDSSQNKSLGKRFKEWAGERIEAFGSQLRISQGFQVLQTGPTLDAKLLVKFIINYTTFHGKLKKDPVAPAARTMLSNNEAKFIRVGRDEAMKRTYDVMATRLEKRLTNKGKEGVPQNNPLPSILATTGGGKSFHLDELGALSPADLDTFCSNLELRDILKNSVAVPITYNGKTPFLKEIDAISDSSLGLSLRVLFSYFISDTIIFDDFVAQMRPLFKELTLAMAIRCIMEHSGKGVLLLTDELMKSGGELKNTALIKGKVSQIGKCLDTLTTHFNAVVTTLDMVATDDETNSGRATPLIHLAPPTLEEALSLFGEDAVKSSILRQCISDCNGHHRSLETLKLVWDECKEKGYSYTMLIQELGKQMHPKYSELSIPLIRAALRGYPVFRGDSPDGKRSYADYLARGFYLNTPDQPSYFVPRISPLQLLLYAHKHVSTNTLDGQCAKVILSMFHLEPNFTWQQYEPFHAYWEVLYRILFCGESNNVCTITDLYQRPVAKGNPASLSHDTAFTLSAKSVTLLEWLTHFPQDLPQKPRAKKDETPKPTPEELEKRDREALDQLNLVDPPKGKSTVAQSVIVAGKNNPGFDLVYFEQTNGNVLEPIVLCVECRFSDPSVTTKLSKDEVKHKRDETVRQFRPYFRAGANFNGFTVKEENLYLVICAFRETNNNVCEDMPVNTIVLDRDQLEALYTPSLATRPQFILRK